MEKGGEALVVRAPKEPGGDLSGEKEIVRVLLHNRLVPEVDVVDLGIMLSGDFRYSYQVCNDRSAKDPIEVFMFPVPIGQTHVCMRHEISDGPWGGPCGPGAGGREIGTEQPFLPGTTVRMYTGWAGVVQPPNSPIEPGECLGGFVIESDYMPGFVKPSVRASVTRFQPDRSWPEQILDQLGDFEERSWFEKEVLTLGPAFPRDTPPSAIAANYQEGVRQLVQQGRLEATSAFTAELLANLEAFSKTTAAAAEVNVNSKPGNKLESDILKALRLSLPVRTSGKQE